MISMEGNMEGDMEGDITTSIIIIKMPPKFRHCGGKN